MSKFQPIYDGDEELRKKNKEFDDRVGRVLGAVQVAAEAITGMGDAERWEIFRTCLSAVIGAGDSMMAGSTPDSPDQDN